MAEISFRGREVKKVAGIKPATFVIDEEGIIISKEEKVNAKENPYCTLNIITNK